ncbi:MAG: hypothetical protein HY886_03180 [Deltaproteobacteria bacterium]|nr:hypothetical protein [Deltaproteobacteria bacterium]
MSNNDEEVLFLETTIQADSIFGERVCAERIRRNLKGKRVCSSIFVLNEFKKTFLNAVILYYNLLVDSPDTHTALRRADKYQNRLHKRITKVYVKICDEVGHDKAAVLEWLESWIEDDLMMEFHANIEGEVVNKTACCRVDAEPVRQGNKYELKIACAKDNPPSCAIEIFWKKHKKELHALASATSLSKDKELSEIPRVAAVIKDGKDMPYGNNCHVVLSDAVIAIEAPEGGQIYTTNRKHFEPICDVIENRKVYTEV